jgi:hypothetical protein
MCHWWICVGYVKVLEVMSGDDVCTCLRGRKSCGNSFVANIVLQVDISSAWEWFSDRDTSYLVGGAYHLLTHLTSRELLIHCYLVWNKFVTSLIIGYLRSPIYLFACVYVKILICGQLL